MEDTVAEVREGLRGVLALGLMARLDCDTPSLLVELGPEAEEWADSLGVWFNER